MQRQFHNIAIIYSRITIPLFYTRSIFRFYSNPQHYYGRETVGELIQTNRTAQALPIINDLIRAENNNVALYIDKGIALLALGQHHDALETFNTALSMKPDILNKAQLNLNKGSTLLQLNRFNEAIECYNRAIILKPGDASYYENRAIAYARYGHIENALKDLNNSISIHPSFRSYLNKGNILRRLGHMEEAVTAYESALSINHNDVSALDGLANTFIAMKRYDESLECVNKAIRSDKHNASLHFKKGILLCQLNRIQEGISCLMYAVELDSSFKTDVETILKDLRALETDDRV